MAIKVCIIGAGAAGLCAARHILKHGHPHFGPPKVFEMSSKVGGTWVYTDKTGRDEHGNPVHSSMYRNLRTNLPKEVMAFPDFPFKDETDFFLSHIKVRKYLEDYCESFKIRPCISFDTRIDLVEPIINGEGTATKWNVTWTDLKDGAKGQDIFDAVLVCNGHYSMPYYGHVEDCNKFQGTQIHSHSYRESTHFKNQRVAVLGAKSSGIDISLELSAEAAMVYLCNKNNLSYKGKISKGTIMMVNGIKACTGPRSFELHDGSILDDIDSLVYCTGYQYSFPFLSDGCNIQVEERLVKSLYKHMINATHPSMAFIGIPLEICPFPLFDVQVRWFCRILMGDCQLPSTSDMIKDTQDEFRKLTHDEGIPARYFHSFQERQWSYNDEIAMLANEEKVPEYVEKLYKKVRKFAILNLADFKNAIIRKNSQDGTYEIVHR